MPVESATLAPAESIEPAHELVRPGEGLPEAVERIRSEELGIDDATWQVAEGLLGQLKEHDSSVYEHSLRSGLYMYGITKLREDHDDAASAFLATCLHDIGKYGIHTDVINYPGTYDTDEQKADMRRHPWFSFQALQNEGFTPEVTLPVAWHHRFPPEGEDDGYGPSLDSEEIKDLTLNESDVDRAIATAKLIMLVDSFDSAMTRNDLTVARKPLSPEERHNKMLARFPGEAARIDWLFARRIEIAS